MAINLDVHGNTQPLEAAVQAAVNRIRRTPIKVTVDDKGATQPLGNMKRGADEFSKSMEAANARIIAFGASMAIMNGVANSFKAVVANAIEVEKALADINVVMGLTASNLDKFSDGLFKVAKETGAAFNIAAQAATEYARQGLSVEESLKRTRDALILTRLTGMDSAQGVKALTAAMNTYGKEIRDTTQLVSKFAAVDVKFAVSAEDFADAIARTGQAAKSAGVSIDELIGLVTAAQQQTARGGKVIGNSFKTIFTRIGRTDTLNQLENLGIAVRDLEGNTLGAKRILTDLANSFDNLSEAQKAQIAQTVGGVFQINVLKAVLSDAAKQNGILANATQISAGATDEAIQKNEQLRQTMAAMATETGLALKDVSAKVGDIMLGPGIEKILNVVKSLADGANAILGDGESAGGKFANGFLKGLGNVITGPGLVVITVVFGKLFLKAAQFAKESLVSLIGVTSEAQKQKAIQSSLVALFGRSASLSKEMLSTETTKAQKEQIILNLLKAQVAEAQMLDSVAKRAATTLYRQGYNASLAPRRGRASGYIPNFAHPERQEAAQGGYAAGNIRSMNMSGGGSVIYNSAEKVKNFAGFTQPAIMPPLSSKAGKNYQQAFGSVHGFDPYAGSGYIPNFNKKVTFGAPAEMSGHHIADMLIPQIKSRSSPSSGLPKPAEREKVARRFGINLNTPQGKALVNKKVLFNIHGVNPKGIDEVSEDEYGGLKERLESSVANAVVNYANALKLGPGISSTAVKSVQQKVFPAKGDATGASGALGSVYGAVFEKALELRFKTEASEREVPGGDFDVAVPNKYINELFGLKGSAAKGIADIKSSAKPDNRNSMAEKILKEILSKNSAVMTGALKSQSLAGRYAVARGARANNPLGYSTRTPRGNARGYIPNFADPLSDAIGRERGAGVPVSQIRVGTHQSLIGKGNPLGIGVTNTKDEPNGLRDVFGADGHIPNYAFRDGASRVISNLLDKWKSVSTVVLSSEKQRELVQMQGLKNQQRFTAQEAVEHMKGLDFNKQETRQSMLQLNYEKQETNEAMKQVGFSRGGAMGAIGNFNSKVGKSAFGKFMGGGGGMGAMMGLSMIGGMLPGASTPGSAGNYASSAMSYASTGMMMGSMAGPFAPIAMAIGGLGGALYGLSQASDEAAEALKAKTAEEQKAADSLMSALAMTGGVEAFQKVGSSMTWAQETVMNEGNKEKLLTAGLSRFGIKRGDLNQLAYGEMVPDNDVATTGKFRGGKQVLPATQISRLSSSGVYRAMQEGRGTVNPVVPKNFINEIGDFGNFYAGHSDMLTKQGKNLEREEAKAYKAAVEAYLIESERFKQIQRQMVEGLRGLPEGETISSKDFGGDGSDKTYLAGEYADKIEGMNENEFVKYFQDTKKYRKEVRKNEIRQAQGLIVQLNNQKAIISAQNQVRLNLLDISDKYKSQIIDLDTQGKIIGDLMTERQKTELRYNKALLKNTEAEEKAKAQANLQFRQGVFSQLSENKALEQRLKQTLISEGKEINKGKNARTVDVTDALSNLSTKELLDLFEKIKNENNENAGIQEAINRLADNELLKRKGLIDAAERTKTLSDDQAEKEKNINFILDQRAQKVKDLAREINLANNLTDQAMKGLAATERTQDARRSFASAGVTGIESQFLAGKQGRQISANRNMRNLALGLGRNMNSLDQEYRSYLLDQRDADRYASSGPGSKAEFDHMMALIEAETERTKKLDEYDQKRSALISTFESERLSIEEILRLENARNKILEDRAIMSRNLDIAYETVSFDLAQARSSRGRAQEIARSKRLTAFGPGSKSARDQFNFDARERNISAANAIRNLRDDKVGAEAQFNKDIALNMSQGLEFERLRGKKNKNKDEEARYKLLLAAENQRKVNLDLLNAKKQATLASLDKEIEKTKILNQEENQRLRAQFKHDRSFSGGLSDGLTQVRNETDLIHHKLAEDLPIKLRDGLAEAMGAAINGAEDLGDVLRGVAMGFLQAIQQAMLQKAAGHMVDMVGGAMGFSGGGRVPAMVTNGEYIMGRDAVKKYGGGFMHSLNARGRIPSYSTGGPHKESAIGMNFGGSEGYATGRRYQSQKMSGFFYSGAAGNVGLQEDAQYTQGIIRERMRKAAEKKAKKRALMQMIVGTALSVGLSAGFGAIASGGGLSADAKASGYTSDTPAGVSMGFDSSGNAVSLLPGADTTGFNNVMPTRTFNPFNMFGAGQNYFSPYYATPNPERYKFMANGGFISGKSGIDQIPAMLSEGEYVIKASSARRLGPQTLNSINAGKFNEGGSVTPLIEKTESGISGGNTNNINISINVDKSGSKGEKSNRESKNPDEQSADQQKERALADRVKEQVVAVIIDEQRPGGLLSD